MVSVLLAFACIGVESLIYVLYGYEGVSEEEKIGQFLAYI